MHHYQNVIASKLVVSSIPLTPGGFCDVGRAMAPWTSARDQPHANWSVPSAVVKPSSTISIVSRLEDLCTERYMNTVANPPTIIIADLVDKIVISERQPAGR